ncbi:hypothetical protein ACVBEQ_25200 [Nakamurella sp. GG22]
MRRKVPIISEPTPDELREALRHSTSALKADGVPFALAGGYALWVHGAPESAHDVDLVVDEDDVEKAVASLAATDFRIERPPEDWLFKAFRGDAMVDVLHRLNGQRVDRELLDMAEDFDVLGLHIPVLPATQVITTKLRSMTERYCDFGQLIAPVRAVREQLDWPRIRVETADNDFAAAFLVLMERLGIAEPATADEQR